MAVWFRRISDGVWVVQDISTYELINNTAVLQEAPSVALYDNIEIRVADAQDELIDSPSDIAIVAGIAAEVTNVSDNMDDVQFVSDNIAVIGAEKLIANVPNFIALQAVTTTYTTKVNLTELHVGIPESGGVFTWDSTANKSTANAGTIIDPSVSLALQGTGVGLGCWVRQDLSKVTPIYFGAVGDGVADDTSAFELWNTYCNTYSLLIRPIGGNKYRITPSAALPITSECIFYGDGMGYSGIIWESDVTDGINLWSFPSPLNSITFKDFFISGTHDVNRSNISTYPLLINNTEKVYIDSVEIYYSRVFGLAVRGATEVSVTNSYVHHCARDGINVANCDHAIVTDNRIEFCDDDSIGIHNQYYSDQRGHIVANNNIKFCQGIKLLGAHVANINNNNLSFCFANAIDITTALATSLEGGTADFNIVINGNTISNHLNRQYIDALNTSKDVISISSTSAQAGTLTAIPGDVTPTGTFDLPYGYYRNVYQPSDATVNTPIPNANGIIISDNIVFRDFKRTGLLSTLGYGIPWTRAGEVDVDLSIINASNPAFIKCGVGKIVNMLVDNNIIVGGYGILTAASTTTFYNAQFTNNIAYDCSFGVVSVAGTQKWDAKFYNNIFDLDPYHANVNRASDGSWSAVGDHTCFLLQGVTGLDLANNIFKNMSRVTDIDFNNAVRDSLITSNHNIFYAGVSAVAFSTSNKGLGYIPDIGESRIINYDADPTSATYGNVINELLKEKNGVPTAGYYISGWTIKNAAAGVVLGGAGSQYIISGWKRITNGSAHVLNTDWVEMRTLTGT